MACHQVEVDEIDLASKVRFEKEQKNTRRTKVELKTNMTLEKSPMFKKKIYLQLWC